MSMCFQSSFAFAGWLSNPMTVKLVSHAFVYHMSLSLHVCECFVLCFFFMWTDRSAPSVNLWTAIPDSQVLIGNQSRTIQATSSVADLIIFLDFSQPVTCTANELQQILEVSTGVLTSIQRRSFGIRRFGYIVSLQEWSEVPNDIVFLLESVSKIVVSSCLYHHLPEGCGWMLSRKMIMTESGGDMPRE